MFFQVVSSLSLVKQVNMCKVVEVQLVSGMWGQNNFLLSSWVTSGDIRSNASWPSDKGRMQGCSTMIYSHLVTVMALLCSRMGVANL